MGWVVGRCPSRTLRRKNRNVGLFDGNTRYDLKF
jgi:hypothetical protein